MGEIFEHLAKRHALSGRFSHRNLKIPFSMGKLRWQPAEKACLWRNISHRKLQNNISVGKNQGSLPKDMHCMEDFPTET
jgi:hypothetical protein